jgi:uncharacterized protein (TIGR02246 family)
MRYVKIIILCITCFLFSCKQEATITPAQTLEELIQADNAGDLEKLISYYAEDAILIPSGRSDIIGKNAIRENYRNLFAISGFQLKAQANEIIESGEWTVIRGNTSGAMISKKDSTSASVDDKFLMMLKKQSGSWKVYRLMVSTNR